jgi:AcrR family transcriptional regulator
LENKYVSEYDAVYDNGTDVSRLTRAQSQAQTTARLVEAAGRAVAERGLGAVSVDEIAERAGYSRGAFYANFPNKEAMLLAVLRGHMEGEIREVTALLDEKLAPPALLERLDRWMHETHADADWTLLSAELQLHALRSPAFGEQYTALQHDHRRALAELLTMLFAYAGRALPVDASVLAATIKALVQGLALQNAIRSVDEERIDSMHMTRIIVEALIKTAPTLQDGR